MTASPSRGARVCGLPILLLLACSLLATGGTGTGGAAGLGGAAGNASCNFVIQDQLSTAIPAVGIVDWSTDLAALSDASVEFTLDDPAPNEINRGSGGPIDVSGQTHRALSGGYSDFRQSLYGPPLR